MTTRLERLNVRIERLEKQRTSALHELRSKCQHLRLVEGTWSGSKPHRICVDCGAEESDWYCGIHVLLIDGDTWAHSRTPGDKRKALGVLLSKTSKWMQYRKDGAPYFVGQSHPNFGGGVHTYAQLTAQ